MVARKLVGIVALASCLALLGACSGGDQADSAAMEAAEGGDGGGGGSDAFAAQYDAGGAVAREASIPGLPERVIKTADLRLEVEEGALGDALREGREIAEAAGGFVLSTSVSGARERMGDFTIRVPAERFDETLSSLEDLGKVVGEVVEGQDVSQEFVDLEARLRNATAQEEVLFGLYERSETIADTIRVQRELEDVQLEIERLRGRLRFLEDRTDLSTISVSLTEDGVVVAGDGPFEKAWDTARKTFVAVVSGVIVGAGFVAPIALFAVVLYLVFRLVRPRLQRATP